MMCVTRSAQFDVIISLMIRGAAKIRRLFFIYFLLMLQDVVGAGSLRAAPIGCRSLKLCLGATLATKIRPVELSQIATKISQHEADIYLFKE